MNTKKYDVIVCGGGPAGVCAAISAAREGNKVLLLEQQNCLGGIWSAGLLSWFIDVDNKKGLIKEIIARLSEHGGRFARARNFICDPEAVKYVLDDMCIKAGVDVVLHSMVTGAVVRNKRIQEVETHSKSGYLQYKGKIFIDATGDGDLGYYCGCEYRWGNEEGLVQPMSLIALVNGLDYSEMIDLDNTLPYNGKSPKKKLLEEIERAGISPSLRDPGLFHLYNDLYIFMVNHEFQMSGVNVYDLTEATMNARAEINRMVAALRRLGGRWKNIRLVASAQAIGVREGRRIAGLYEVSKDDLIHSAKHIDCICKTSFGMDVHALTKDETSGYHHTGGVTSEYDIPFRALVSKDIDNLMMAGRCISGDFYAHSSYRVTGNAATLGEAAGRGASKAIAIGITPQELAERMHTEGMNWNK